MIFTFTYAGRSSASLPEILGPDGVLFDCRMSPRSKVVEWNGAALRKLLGAQYVHASGFGNENFREANAPTKLADPEPWIARALELHAAGKNVFLMCACKSRRGCHRDTVASVISHVSGLVIDEWKAPPQPPKEGQKALF